MHTFMFCQADPIRQVRFLIQVFQLFVRAHFQTFFFSSDTEQTSAKGRYAIELWHKCRHILKKRIALLDKIFRNHEKYSYGSRVSVLTTEFKYR